MEVSPPAPPLAHHDLAARIAEATRSAWNELPRKARDRACLVALQTSGEALRPYFGLTVHGPEQWDLPDSPFDMAGDEHFEALTEAWDATPDVYADRLATMEAALRLLDVEGLFGSGASRERILLQVATMPPDQDDAGYVRRLNADGPLLTEWLAEASECPPLDPDEAALRTGPWAGDPAAPNATMASLWRVTPGIRLADGTVIHGPDSVADRDAADGTGSAAPGWVLVGEDGEGGGYVMRRGDPAFRAVEGRSTAEVFLLDPGAGALDVEQNATFVTDDLIGWAACRQEESAAN